MSKRKITAIALFIFMSLFIFTFANPGEEGLTPVNNEGNNDETADNSGTTEDDTVLLPFGDGGIGFVGDPVIPPVVVPGDDTDETDEENEEPTPDEDGLTINFEVLKESLNGKNWSDTNIRIAIIATNLQKEISTISWGVTTDETPNLTTTENYSTIDSMGLNYKEVLKEGINQRLCAQVEYVDGTLSEISCTDPYYIDKTKPVFTGLETIEVEINGTLTKEDLMQGVVVTDKTPGSGVNITRGVELNKKVNGVRLDLTTAGTYEVQYKVFDNAGNKRTATRTIIVKADAPTVDFVLEKEVDKVFNENGWAKKNFNVIVDVTDYSNTGIKATLYCVDTEPCTPKKELPQDNEVKIKNSSATNQICVLVEDNRNNEEGKSQVICSETYQLDKDAREISDYTADPTNIIVGQNDVVLAMNQLFSNADTLSGNGAFLPVLGDGVYFDDARYNYYINTAVLGPVEVTYESYDKAGNKTVHTRTYNVVPYPEFTFEVEEGTFNAEGWAKDDFAVTLDGVLATSSVQYCLTNETEDCTPTISSFPRITIDQETNGTRICVLVTNQFGKQTSKCSEVYKLDKSNPNVINEKNNGIINDYNKTHINLVITDTNLDRVEYTLNGGPVKTRNPLTPTSNKYQFGDSVSGGEGNYVVTAYDKAGNSTKVEFTVDKTAPVINGVVDGGMYNTAPTITVTETNLDAVVITKDGQPFSGDLTDIKEDGVYTITATDKAGHSATVTFTIDQTAPKIVNEKNNGVINDYNKTHINLVITDTNLDRVEYTLNGGPVKVGKPINTGSNKYQFGDVTRGEGYYVVTAYDKAGNSTTVEFTVDKTAPVINGVVDGGMYNITPTITIDEVNLDTVVITKNGNPYTKGLGSIQYDGVYIITATDKAGHSTTVKFTIDKTGPEIINSDNNGIINEYNKSQINLLITDKYLEKVEYTVNGGPVKAGKPINTGSDKYQFGDVTRGEGYYVVTAYDKAGNSTTVEFTVDRTNPTITGINDGETTNQNVMITITEKNLASFEITRNGIEVSRDIDFTKEVNSFNNSGDGLYVIKVVDKAGRTAELSFTIDKTGPVINGVANNGIYNTVPTITVTEKNLDTVVITKNGQPFTGDLTDIKADGTYTITATDKAGNTATVTFILDQTNPVITDSETDSTNVEVAMTSTVKVMDNITASDATSGINTFIPTGDNVYLENGVYYLVTTTPGPTEVTYTATDNAGNASTSTRTYNVIAPTPTLTLSANPSLNNNGWAKEDIAVTINTTETNYTVKSCLTDQATCTPITDNGLLITNESASSKMCVTITSQYNVESAVACTNAYKLDKTPPTPGTLVLSGTLSSTGWYTSNVNISVTGTSDSLSGYGGIQTNHTKNIVTTDGDNIMVRAYINDAAGNSSYLTQYIKRDTVAPRINGVDNNGIYKDVPTINIVEDYLSTVAILKNGQPFSNDLADINGSGTYTITAVDQAGHSATVTFEIDQTGPEIINSTNNGIIDLYNKSHLNLLITDTRFDRVEYTVNGGPVKTNQPMNVNSNPNLYQFGDVTRGEGHYVVTAYDTLGNSTEVEFIVDKTAPTITGITNGEITDQDVMITITEKNLESVVITKDGQVVTKDIDLTKEVNTFSVTESGLYVIKVVDKVGRTAELSFTIDKELNKVVSIDATHSEPNTYSRGTTEFDYSKILVEATTKAGNTNSVPTGSYSITPIEGTFNKVLTLRETKTATVTYEGMTDTFEYVLVRTHAEALIEYAKEKYSHLDQNTQDKIESLYGTIGDILTKYEDDLLNAYNSNEDVKNIVDQAIIDIVKQLEMIADDKELQAAIKEDIVNIYNDIKTIINETSEYLDGLDAETKAIIEAATKKINETIDTLSNIFETLYNEIDKLETEIKDFIDETEQDINDIIKEFENKIAAFDGSIEELIKLIEEFSNEVKNVIIPNIKEEANTYFKDLTNLYATEMEASLNNYINNLETTINNKLENIMNESIKDLLAIVFGIDNLTVEEAKIYADALMALQNTDFEALLNNLNDANAALNEYKNNAPVEPTGKPEAPVAPASTEAEAIANAIASITKADLQAIVNNNSPLEHSRVDYDAILALIHNGNFDNLNGLYDFDGLDDDWKAWENDHKAVHTTRLVTALADIVKLIDAKTAEAKLEAGEDYATALADYNAAKKEYDEVLLPAWDIKWNQYLAQKEAYDQEVARLEQNANDATSALMTEAKTLLDNVTALVEVSGLNQEVLTSATQMVVSLVTGDTASALNHFKNVMSALTNNSNTIAFVMDAYTPISNLVTLGTDGFDESDLETLADTAREIIELAEKHNIDQEINKALNAIIENIENEFNAEFVKEELNNLQTAVVDGIKNATNKLGTEQYPLLPSDKLTEIKNNILKSVDNIGTIDKVNELIDNLINDLVNGKIIDIVKN